jgi:uncharacterized protein with GYD domain
MSTFIVLLDFTNQGIRNVSDSPHRADRFKEMASERGAKIVAQYWTTGSHDGVFIMEAPNDEVAASILISLAQEGNVRTTTLRAFDWAQAKDLIESTDA